MPRQFAMTWNNVQRRWFKKIGGRQLAVSCKALAKSYPALFEGPTKEGSYRAANKWWEDRQPDQTTGETLADVEGQLGDLALALQRGRIDVGQWAAKTAEPNRKREALLGGRIGRILRDYEQTDDPGALANEVYRLYVDQQAAEGPGGSTIGEALQSFLAAKLGAVGVKISDGRYDNIQREAKHFAAFIGEGQSINSVNGQSLAGYHTHLLGQIKGGKIGNAYAKGYLQTARQFLRWTYETNLLSELPRNIDSKTILISVPTKEVETYTLAEVKALLKAAPSDKTRLYILLALNTGMTQQDIADLRQQEVDWTAGTITRKRSKTRQIDSVPTVTYRLWPETFRLLKALRDTRTDRVITTREGLALVRRDLVKGKLRRNDTVRQAFIKISADNKKGFKHLRKTSASLLASHRDYTSVAGLFLGHAPRGVAEKHYTRPAEELLSEGLVWLGGQYGVG